MNMHRAIYLLAVLIGTAAYAESPFSERVRVAKGIESQEETQTYLYKVMFPAVGPLIASAMKECTSRSNASTEGFTVVADVTQAGQFSDVAYEPKTNTAACFAAALRLINAPSPPTCDCGPLPIVIDMKITP